MTGGPMTSSPTTAGAAGVRRGAVEVSGRRTVMVVSGNASLRRRVAEQVAGLRCLVVEAAGGADALAQIESHPPEAMLMDSWLPDLEACEFAAEVRLRYPELDLLALDGTGLDDDGLRTVAAGLGASRDPLRDELLRVARQAWEDAASEGSPARTPAAYRVAADGTRTDGSLRGRPRGRRGQSGAAVPEMVGSGRRMRELGELIRVVAPRSTTVLIEGETGAGKEIVARLLHSLSTCAERPFILLNCAAIHEALLESELFGHARGAFNGAAEARVGRIEAADGGTLLLDEIGDMPVAMQTRMLRFLESGELQRVGEDHVVRVDVRVIAATHQPLEELVAAGRFRLDLYHRLAVFPLEVPPLRERTEDLPELAEHLLRRIGEDGPAKRLTSEALAKLAQHAWPGNVRELMHVLERGAILSGESREVGADDIRYRRATRGG